MNLAAIRPTERRVFSDPQEESIEIPGGITSLAQFRTWTRSEDFPEQGRISWIGGKIIVDMSPERIFAHNQVKSEIFFVLKAIAKKHDLGMIFSDGARLVHAKADVSNQPDLLFVSWKSLKDGRVKIELSEDEDADNVEIVGSPDMVLEVVSPSSARKDAVVMLDRYFRAGVAEYWLADARKHEVSLQIHRRGAKKFEAASELGDWQVSTVFRRRFRLERGRNQAHLWTFNLLNRSL